MKASISVLFSVLIILSTACGASPEVTPTRAARVISIATATPTPGTEPAPAVTLTAALLPSPEAPSPTGESNPEAEVSPQAEAEVWISNGPEGGNITALAIDPATPTTIYAGTEEGGLFKSTDGGGSWGAVNDGLTNRKVRTVAIDPVSPDTLYVGVSGEMLPPTPGGIFKSTNGGQDWHAVYTGSSIASILALAMDPATPATLYAAAWTEGVLKSRDGGATWNAAKNGLADDASVVALAIVESHKVVPGNVSQSRTG